MEYNRLTVTPNFEHPIRRRSPPPPPPPPRILKIEDLRKRQEQQRRSGSKVQPLVNNIISPGLSTSSFPQLPEKGMRGEPQVYQNPQIPSQFHSQSSMSHAIPTRSSSPPPPFHPQTEEMIKRRNMIQMLIEQGKSDETPIFPIEVIRERQMYRRHLANVKACVDFNSQPRVRDSTPTPYRSHLPPPPFTHEQHSTTSHPYPAHSALPSPHLRNNIMKHKTINDEPWRHQFRPEFASHSPVGNHFSSSASRFPSRSQIAEGEARRRTCQEGNMRSPSTPNITQYGFNGKLSTSSILSVPSPSPSPFCGRSPLLPPPPPPPLTMEMQKKKAEEAKKISAKRAREDENMRGQMDQFFIRQEEYAKRHAAKAAGIGRREFKLEKTSKKRRTN